MAIATRILGMVHTQATPDECDEHSSQEVYFSFLPACMDRTAVAGGLAAR
jgi:hypothetical protein